MTKRQLIDHIYTLGNLDEPVAYTIWQIDDVLSLIDPVRFGEQGISGFSNNEIILAKNAINYVERHKEASLGITWDDLADAIRINEQ